MATSQNKNEESEEKSGIIIGPGPVVFWERCEGETLKLCKLAMKGIEKEFLGKCKEFKIKIYETTNKGICLIQFTQETFIGVVKLTLDGAIANNYYYASVRVLKQDKNKEEYKLQGFFVSKYSNVKFVEDGQYHISLGQQRFPKGWQSCNNKETVTMLKDAMKGIKDEFFAVAKIYGYQGNNNAYDPTDSGICLLTDAGIGVNCYIGFVQLSKKDDPGLYYASIKVSQLMDVMPPQPYKLLGFIIDMKPWLQFVCDGVHRVGGSIVSSPLQANNNNNNNNDKDDSKLSQSSNVLSVRNGMSYIATGYPQQLVDNFKDIIKQMANISGDLDTYQVVCATSCMEPYVCNF